MSETLIAAIIGGTISLITTIITSAVNAVVEFKKKKNENQQAEFEMKRENLKSVYAELIGVVNAFPNQSPNDVLKYMEDAPDFSMEFFDPVVKVLRYQREDYETRLRSGANDFEEKGRIESEIRNRKYAQNEILKIKQQYYDAKEKQQLFNASSKIIFDLYAGQEVKNCLVEFEVLIHNVFISGNDAGDSSNPLNNLIEKSRRNLVYSMRRDIGIE